MKFILRASALAVAAGLIVGIAQPAHAGERVTAKVPFTFIVGNERLPAGDYEVKEMSDGGGILAVQSADGRHAAIVTAINGGPGKELASPAELTFEKFNNEYFLAGIAIQDGNDWEIRLSPKSMQKVIAHAAYHARQ
ncbi:MAG: hypothetical protein DMF89_13275 [Acidobacteria bacterium]|nr:MAG: hypothetical protein DMF89_13275 [Acidobacteriota bacterium]